MLGQAQNVASTPYKPYGGELVAGINGQQGAGINAVNSASGIQDPYNSVAGGLAGASASAIDPEQFSGAALQQFENPYQSDVVNSTEAEIGNQNQQQAANLTSSNIGAGAFGGDRSGVSQAALAGQQDVANNATLAGLNTSNFQNAESEFNTQQGVNLGAEQNTAARQLAASQQLGNLGQTAQGEALNEANAQTNAGTLEQSTQQAQDTANYNQFMQQQAYPFQTTGWLANIMEGIGSQSGGSSNGQTTTQGGSGLGSILGAGLGLAGMFLKRGGRVPHRATGGGLVPYGGEGIIDPTTGVPTGLGGGSVVPTVQLQVGHTMPNGQTSNANAGASANQNNMNQMQQQMKGVQGLGNAFQNSSLGDSLSDSLQDFGDGLGGLFARGGMVLGDGGLMRLKSRRHYDDGGLVASPSPADLLWVAATDPLGTGQPVNATAPTPPAPSDSPYGGLVPVTPSPSVPAPPAMDATGVAMPNAPPAPTTMSPSALGLGANGVPTGGGSAWAPSGGIAPATGAGTTPSASALAQLGKAMGVPASPAVSPYGDLSDVPPAVAFTASNVPLPPVRPAGLGDVPAANVAPTGSAGLAASSPSPAVYATTGGGRMGPPQVTLASGTGLAPGDGSSKWAQYNQLLANGDVQGALKLSEGLRTTPYWDVNHLRTGYGSDTVTHADGTSGPVGPNTVITPAEANLDLQRRTAMAAQTAQEAVGKSWGGMTPGAKAALTSVVYNYGHLPSDIAAAGASGDPAALSKAIADHADDNDGVNAGRRMAEAAAVSGTSLAYQGSPGPAPASAAIAGATSQPGSQGGLGGVLSHLFGGAQNADAPVAGGSEAQSQPGGGGLFGLHLSDAQRQAMLAAGLGMMSSTSMNPWIGIGQGGLQGLSAYNNARQLQSEIDLRRAQAERQMVETGLLPARTASEIGLQQSQAGRVAAETPGAQAESELKAMQVKAMHRFLDQDAADQAAKAKAVESAAGNGSSSSAPAPAAPIVSPANPPVAPAAVPGTTVSSEPKSVSAAPPATTSPTAPARSSHTIMDVDPRTDPIELRRAADEMSMVPTLKDRADRLYAQSAAIMSGDQQVLFKDGRTGYYPGVGEAKATQSALATAAQESARVPAAVAQNAAVENFKTQNAARTQAAGDAETGQAMLAQAQAMRDVMFDPQTGAPRVNTGPLGPLVSKIAAVAEQAGVSPTITKLLTGTNPDDSQSLEKFRTALGSESARQDLPGSPVRVSEFQRYLASVPSNEILPAAFKYLLDTAIVPKAQQQIGAYEAVKDLDPSKDNIQGTLFSYRQQHPWYNPAVAAAARPEAQGSTTAAAPAITPEMARAELARRAALRQQQGANP